MDEKLVKVKCNILLVCCILFLAWPDGGAGKGLAETTVVVAINTSMGSIKVQLWPDKAPATVENFLRYVKEGRYDGTIFHRVIDGFMIQGGGFTPDRHKIKTFAPVKNEAASQLKNLAGTIAMARTMVVDSATSQFFINLKDNGFLDHRDNTPAGYGYAVFGRVIGGMDVVKAIGRVKTTRLGRYSDVPIKPVVIESIRVVKP